MMRYLAPEILLLYNIGLFLCSFLKSVMHDAFLCVVCCAALHAMNIIKHDSVADDNEKHIGVRKQCLNIQIQTNVRRSNIYLNIINCIMGKRPRE